MNIGRIELVQQLVDKYNFTKSAASEVIDTFTSIILENMENGNTVSIRGFGCFDMSMRAARSCPNPQTGERCDIPEHWVPKFHPGRGMRFAVKKWEDSHARGLK